MSEKLSAVFLLTIALVSGAPGAAGNGQSRPQSTQERLEQLRSLPYTAAPDPKARTGLLGMHESEVMPGYNLFANRYSGAAALMDNRGRIVQRWSTKDRSSWLAVEVTPRAELFVLHGWDAARNTQYPAERGFPSRLTKLAPDSSVIWSVPLPVHHDIDLLSDGRLLVLLERVRKTRAGRIVDNTIAYLSPNGKVLREISLYDMLRRVPGLVLQDAPKQQPGTPADLFHANAVRELEAARAEEIARAVGNQPEAKRLFAAGNVLVSSRNQSLLAVVDPKTENVVWSWGRGELDHPHCARFLANGNVLVFDNGFDRGWSRVVEVNPLTNKIVWSWAPQDRKSFYVAYGGGCQRLPNGNTLITNSSNVTAFEVTRDGRVVWLWSNPDQTFMYRLRRVPDDYFVPQVRQQFAASVQRPD